MAALRLIICGQPFSQCRIQNTHQKTAHEFLTSPSNVTLQGFHPSVLCDKYWSVLRCCWATQPQSVVQWLLHVETIVDALCLVVGCCGRGLTLTLSQSSNCCLPAAQGRWWKKSAPATSSVVTISLFGLPPLHPSPPPSPHLLFQAFLLLSNVLLDLNSDRFEVSSLQLFHPRCLTEMSYVRVWHFKNQKHPIWGLKWLNWPAIRDPNWQCMHPQAHTQR